MKTKLIIRNTSLTSKTSNKTWSLYLILNETSQREQFLTYLKRYHTVQVKNQRQTHPKVIKDLNLLLQYENIPYKTYKKRSKRTHILTTKLLLLATLITTQVCHSFEPKHTENKKEQHRIRRNTRYIQTQKEDAHTQFKTHYKLLSILRNYPTLYQELEISPNQIIARIPNKPPYIQQLIQLQKETPSIRIQWLSGSDTHYIQAQIISHG